uniref:IF rod domain-containing protein n=1 Tax=Caenorhabditis japonica TaxID=281687 RepID=A0A8R1DXX4_CAEJA
MSTYGYTRSSHEVFSSNAGHLVSGMSSAGAICTTALRDAREKEKREIGILNDRLADYIEKVRFLKAQNYCLEHDIEILRRGFSGSSHVSTLYDSEITHSKRSLEQVIAGRTAFQKEVTTLSTDIEAYRAKWLDTLKVVRAHRADHDVDLDKLAKVEAEVSIYARKIRIVEEDVHRIRRENDLVLSDISKIRGLVHSEVSIKAERSRSTQDLLSRVQYLKTDNASRIEQELLFIRRDTTAENRDHFRHELQAAMRDIRADYEAISYRNRQDIEIWYSGQLEKIRRDTGSVNVHAYKEELVSIRSVVSGVTSRLSEIESRNTLLASQINDLRQQQTEDARIYELTLSEKDDAIAVLRERCEDISLQMSKLCDIETSLNAELERYRTLLNGANITTYLASSTGGAAYTGGALSSQTRTTRIVQSSSSTGGGGVHVGGHIGGISVGGHTGGYSISGHVGGYSASAHVGSTSHVTRSSAAHSYTNSSSTIH